MREEAALKSGSTTDDTSASLARQQQGEQAVAELVTVRKYH